MSTTPLPEFNAWVAERMSSQGITRTRASADYERQFRPVSAAPTPIDPNSPAYACDNAYLSLGDRRGITTRTAFILAAMQGLAANPECITWTDEVLGAYAVKRADAAIAAANRVERTPSL